MTYLLTDVKGFHCAACVGPNDSKAVTASVQQNEEHLPGEEGRQDTRETLDTCVWQSAAGPAA